ncbi:MAG: hypothetical protein FJ145_20340 [Deltaproteobacteria bacterium]|nr:hypothetical protein [Deltaproteobacteria bacterium]
MNDRPRYFFPIVPLGVPFWNRATFRSIVRCLLLLRVRNGPDLALLATRIGEFFSVGRALLCGSGSLALELALRQCDIHAGDEVVIPSFCCSAVVPPILAVGAVPVLADVGNELNLTAHAVNAALTGKTRAIVVPHLFGNPAAAIGAIVELARAKGVRVVDDAAQALGAVVDGKPVGSLGDCGIVSFGPEKVCAGLGGGVLLARDTSSREKSGIDLATPRWSAIVSQLAQVLVWRRWRRWTLRAEPHLRRVANPDEAPAPYRQEKFTNLNAAVALSLLRTLEENIAARRERVELYRLLLSKANSIELIPHAAGSACLTQVVRIVPAHFKDDAAARVIAELKAAGYEVQGSFVPIHLLEAFPQCVWDWLPNTERLWSDLVELPCGPEVDLVDIERIAEICRRVAATRSDQSRVKVATTGP